MANYSLPGVQTVNRFAVIITHNRPELLAQCVASIAPQVDAIVVLDNASQPPVEHGQMAAAVRRHPSADARVVVVREAIQPPNISLLWRIGLGYARSLYMGDHDTRHSLPSLQDYHVAMLCDDALVPAGWFSTVCAEMVRTGATAGASDPFDRPGYNVLKTSPDNDIMGRMPGHAFMLNASAPQPDASMHWWWCDTDLDFQARKMGGFVMVGGPGLGVVNVEPNHYTNVDPKLAERAGVDGEAFVGKWGFRPW